MKHVTYLLMSIIFFGCIHTDEATLETVGEVDGYAPVYAESQSEIIEFVSAYPLKKPGKIYVYGSYLFVNELNEGVHIINNADPSQPDYYGFIIIPGNVDMAVKGNYLYADNMGDLLTIDISNLGAPKVTDRKPGIYADTYARPPEQGYFECLDPARRHLFKGWEKKVLNNPECSLL